MSILELKRLTAGDSGEYKCIASNRAGKTSVSADMVVYGLCSVKNRPRSIYQYSNMAPRLSGHTSIFGGDFFVFKSLLGVERRKKL